MLWVDNRRSSNDSRTWGPVPEANPLDSLCTARGIPVFYEQGMTSTGTWHERMTRSVTLPSNNRLMPPYP